MYEVELKFRLPDPRPVLDRIGEWGARPGGTFRQSDIYFRHPQRDFEQTDEALRIRSLGGDNFVTYKGPVVDSRTKTRREIEVPIGDGPDAAAKFAEILTLLGFQPVRHVEKQRTLWHLIRDGREFEVALDDVAGLGIYLEIETRSDEAGRIAARDAILAVAAELQLSKPERKSYLALLLAGDSGKV